MDVAKEQDIFEILSTLANEKLAFVVHEDLDQTKILYRPKHDIYTTNDKTKLESASMAADTKILLMFIRDKVGLEGKEEWCLVGRYNEDLGVNIETNFHLKTRRLSEGESLQRTIKYYTLPSITPSLDNVISATKLEDNRILAFDNLLECCLLTPAPNFYVDLGNMSMRDWGNKYMLASDHMKFPCLLVSFSDVSALYCVDKDRSIRTIDHLSFNVRSIQGIIQQIIPNTSFERIMKMASVGDIKNVDLLWGEVIGDTKKEGFYKFPNSITSFPLGKLSSNNFYDKKSYSQADLASGMLSYLTHTLIKSVLLQARALNIEQVYACGDVFLNTHFRETFEYLCLHNSLRFFMQDNKLLKTHVLETPSHLTVLGAWLGKEASTDSI